MTAYSEAVVAVAAVVKKAYEKGFKDGRAHEFNSTKVMPMAVQVQQAPGLNQQYKSLSEVNAENLRYVKTPWGLMDRYAQKFVET